MKEFLGSLDLSLSFAAHAAEALNWHVAYASVVAFLLVRHFDSNLTKHDAIALRLLTRSAIDSRMFDYIVMRDRCTQAFLIGGAELEQSWDATFNCCWESNIEHAAGSLHAKVCSTTPVELQAPNHRPETLTHQNHGLNPNKHRNNETICPPFATHFLGL